MKEPRILIVEDEPIVAADLSAHLHRLDYQPVGRVATGAQAIALAGELRPDLVLMDIKLEGPMDGVTAAQEIHQQFHIPSIFLSAFSEKATIERAKVAEPFGYILKPFEGRELRANIEMALYKHRAEERLRQSEERYRLLVEDSPDAIGIYQEGKLVFINATGAKLFGANTTQELLGRKSDQVIHPEDYPAAVARLRRRRAGDAGVYPAEVRYLRLDGSAVTMEVSAEPITFEGQPAMQFIARDITERKRLEERARQAQKLEAIGHLAGGMAHEFNNILAALIMNLDLAQRQGQTPEAAGCLSEIEALAQRSATLVKQLLAFGRKAVLHRQPLDLAELVSQQSKLLDELLGGGIRLELQLTAQPAWVEADKTSLAQVLLNLGLNARDAMKDGGVLSFRLAGVEVGAETAAAHPQVSPGKFVCLSVTDTGCGMDAKIMARLFEPFFTTKDVGQGTGLGLATVRGLVEQQHGWVEAESRVGEGSTFRVYLPATAPAPAATRAASGTGMVRGEGTILLVEDEPALLKVGKILLSRSGYTVLTATDGGEALAVWAQHQGQIDLLFTDMVMPGKLSGLQLAERFRAEQPGLKVIITSGYNADMPDPDKDYAAADIVYLPKPCPAPLLTRVIHDCLQRK